MNLVIQVRPWGGTIGKPKFTRDMQAIIREYAPMAWLDGMRDGQVIITSLAELTEDERATLQLLTQRQVQWVPVLADAIWSGQGENAVLNRIYLWANKGMMAIYEAAKAYARRNQMLKWVMGATEHCDSCLACDGQVHRGSEWLEYGLIPRSDQLLCNGFNCQCELVVTTETRRGNLDSVPTTGIPKGEFQFGVLA